MEQDGGIGLPSFLKRNNKRIAPESLGNFSVGNERRIPKFFSNTLNDYKHNRDNKFINKAMKEAEEGTQRMIAQKEKYGRIHDNLLHILGAVTDVAEAKNNPNYLKEVDELTSQLSTVDKFIAQMIKFVKNETIKVENLNVRKNSSGNTNIEVARAKTASQKEMIEIKNKHALLVKKLEQSRDTIDNAWSNVKNIGVNPQFITALKKDLDVAKSRFDFWNKKVGDEYTKVQKHFNRNSINARRNSANAMALKNSPGNGANTESSWANVSNRKNVMALRHPKKPPSSRDVTVVQEVNGSNTYNPMHDRKSQTIVARNGAATSPQQAKVNAEEWGEYQSAPPQRSQNSSKPKTNSTNAARMAKWADYNGQNNAFALLNASNASQKKINAEEWGEYQSAAAPMGNLTSATANAAAKRASNAAMKKKSDSVMERFPQGYYPGTHVEPWTNRAEMLTKQGDPLNGKPLPPIPHALNGPVRDALRNAVTVKAGGKRLPRKIKKKVKK